MGENEFWLGHVMSKTESVVRQSMIERLVALNGGRASARRRYEQFSDEGLQRALELEMAAAEEIARIGRLAAVWSEDGAEIDSPAEVGKSAVERQSLIERLVALNGGSEAVRKAYLEFPDGELRQIVASAERNAARWRSPLEGKWNDIGDELISDEPANLLKDAKAE